MYSPGYSKNNPSDITQNLILMNTIRNNNLGRIDAGSGITLYVKSNVLAYNHIFDDRVEKLQWYGVLAYAPDNISINNNMEPNIGTISLPGGFCQVGVENRIIDFEYDKPWLFDAVPIKTLKTGQIKSPAHTTNKTTISQTYDDTSIQKQIDLLFDKGGIVLLKSGTYIIRKPVILNPNITLQGAGADKTILKLADGVRDCVIGACGSIIPYRPVFNITIRDLTIDGNAGHNSDPAKGSGIRLEGVYNYKIENVHVKNTAGFAGIYTNTFDYYNATPQNKRSFILNCTVENSKHGSDGLYGHGIYVTSAGNDNVVIKGNIARDNDGTGIFAEDMLSNILIENNKAYNNKGNSGIWINETRNSIVRFNDIRGNLIRGITLGGENPEYNRNNLVYGNTVIDTSGYDGIIVGGKAMDNLVIYNRIHNFGDYGINVISTGNIIAFNYINSNSNKNSEAKKTNISNGNTAFDNGSGYFDNLKF